MFSPRNGAYRWGLVTENGHSGVRRDVSSFANDSFSILSPKRSVPKSNLPLGQLNRGHSERDAGFCYEIGFSFNFGYFFFNDLVQPTS